MTTYTELRLRIDRGVGRGAYRIAATGPGGEAFGRFKLPFSELELENFILRVGSTRRGRRRVDSPEMEMAKNFGSKLFGALFEGDVRELYRSSIAETRSAGHGLRVTLSLTGSPELLQVPWEYMYDHPSFLSISTWTPIVRYLDLPRPRRPLQIELPLRILALVSAPVDAEAIDAGEERAKLERALAPLVGVGAISIDWLEEASLRALQHQLRKQNYHVFHFIGHGGYDLDADDGVLLFEDEQGRGRRVSGSEIGTILADEVSLRLAVLNSCEGARTSVQDPFSGVATSLIEREIPAVIGMQFEITDRAAIVFAGEFYAALADGLPVDSSVAEARKAIFADQNDIEWGTPVLFMRVADGRLFDVQAHAPVRPPEPTPMAEPDEARAAAEEAARRSEAADAERAAAAEAERAAAAEAERVAAAEADRVAAAGADAGLAEASVSRDPVVAAAAVRESNASAPEPSVIAPAGAVVHPGLAWATGRAALGGVLTVLIGDIWTVVEVPNADNINGVVATFVNASAVMAIAMAGAVTLAEALVPAVRVPGGSVYRAVGGNRWSAAAIQGAVTGATVGFGVTVLAKGWLFSLDTVLFLAFWTAATFVIAEAVLGRLFRRPPDQPTAA